MYILSLCDRSRGLNKLGLYSLSPARKKMLASGIKVCSDKVAGVTPVLLWNFLSWGEILLACRKEN